jgi:arsenate reductase-like glutaredoxin family protein
MSCKRAQGFLDANAGAVGETVDSSKHKIGRAEALKLLAEITLLVAMRGKNVVTFDMMKDRPNDETLLSHMMGPTGNLRAPTLRVGNTLIVGYNEEAYRKLLGNS